MPNSTSSFNQSSNHSTLHRQNHPPDCSSTRRFRPPETKSPSQYRQTAPITTTFPISGGRNRTRRVKTSPKRGAAGKYVGVMTEGQGKVSSKQMRVAVLCRGVGFRNIKVADGKKCGSNDRKSRGKVCSEWARWA